MLQRRIPKTNWFAGLLFALVSFVSIEAHAQHLSSADYEQNLHRAIQALQEVEEIEEAGSPYYYQNELNRALTTVRDALPAQQSVQGSDEVCNVDNTWLHDELTELEGASADKRPDQIARVIERLQALEERVAYERRAATEADNKVYTKGKLESILARPEYAPQAQGPNALLRLIQDFAEWIERHLPKFPRVRSGGSSAVGWLMQLAVLVVALLVMFYVARILLRRFRGSPRKRASKKRKAVIILGEQLQPEDTATDLLSEAEALARQGDVRAAIRKAYIALLLELGDRNLITLAHHKTNRDYLNAVSSVPLLHSAMRALTDSFERHWYGFADATETDWNNFRSRYHAALQKPN
ncbi:MAG TPA: DUF4129 domain-containing protein [Pyrinomonadaceae bacterium]|nr:DUF4129 domain-containing protein [Pyrinomonadaceae bacterium]